MLSLIKGAFESDSLRLNKKCQTVKRVLLKLNAGEKPCLFGAHCTVRQHEFKFVLAGDAIRFFEVPVMMHCRAAADIVNWSLLVLSKHDA